MTDITTHIEPKSNQLNSDDMIAAPMTFIVQQVDVAQSGEQAISVWLQNFPRPYKPCKSMARVLATAWGTDSAAWAGQGFTLYRDPTVKWAGVEVGGIRISHMTNISQPLKLSLTASRGKRTPFIVQPLIFQQQPTNEGF